MKDQTDGRSLMRTVKLIIALAVLWMFVDSVFIYKLPDYLHNQANKIETKHLDLIASIDQRAQGIEAKLKQPEQAFLKTYADREKWHNQFAQAHTTAQDGRDYYQAQLLPLIHRNRLEDEKAATSHLKQILATFKKADKLAKVVVQRMSFLTEARTNATEWVRSAGLELKELDKLLEQTQTPLKKAKKKHPKRADEIYNRFNLLQKLADDAHKGYEEARIELPKVASDTADYALLGDGVVLVGNNLKSLKENKTKFEKSLKTLSRSYSKTLMDMRSNFFIVVGRATWCERESCRDGNTDHYPAVQVDESTYDFFDIVGGDPFQAPSNRLEALKIDKSWRRDYSLNYENYWIEHQYANYYHKYLILEDGKEKQSEWEKISETSFWDNHNNMGMTLVSKPYGVFEDEKSTTPTPAGLAYVADPTMVNGQPTGSNQYGEWREDSSSGSSYWYYSRRYRLFNDMNGTSNRYDWNHYNDWNGNYRPLNKPYYGQNNSEYGTYGKRTYSGGSRHQKSEYARKNPTMVRDSLASKPQRPGQKSGIRGAGSSSRGRGPGGGGK
jgi:hypothetical protein